jgi:hypothetical protein
MGSVDIIKNGNMVRLTRGEFVFESKTFICDNCETEQPEWGSEITSADGLALFQFCEMCKHLTNDQKRARLEALKGKK